MSTKEETLLSRQVQKLIQKRGGYGRKNHGNMITVVGLSDLSFTYKGLGVYWEIKTPEGYRDLLRMKKNGTLDARAQAQGIHCRLAKNAGAITAVISNLDQANYLLSLIDNYTGTIPTFHEWFRMNAVLNEVGDWDDGTGY